MTNFHTEVADHEGKIIFLHKVVPGGADRSYGIHVARLAGEFKSRMILQVHDELLFEAPEPEMPRLTKLVKEVMEGVHKLSVPIVAETKAGPNWRDMK